MKGHAKRGREWAICRPLIYCNRDVNSTDFILACSYHPKAVLLKNLECCDNIDQFGFDLQH